MNLVKSLLLFTGLALGLSSCIVAGPGYGYRRGPGYYRPAGLRMHYHARPHHYGPRRY